MIRSIKDIYYISADKFSNNKLGIKGVDGQALFLDIDYNKYHHAVQNGIVEFCPGRISASQSNDIPLVQGDKVYFHHFIVQKDNLYLNEGKEYYKCDHRDIYCVIRDGKINMLEEWILCVPVLEPEENFFKGGLYLKPTRENLPFRATIKHVSKLAKEAGLNVGDEIIYRADADYEMPIEGDKYYRMKFHNVVAIVGKDGLVPTKNNVIVKTYNNDQEQIGSILVVHTKKVRQQKANVIAGDEDITKGSDIIYFLGSATDFQYGGETFTLLKKESVVAEVV